MLESLSIDTAYLKCSERLRGPAGACLPKDTRAFNEYVKKEGASLFQALVDDMNLYPKTVIIESCESPATESQSAPPPQESQ